MSFGFAVSDFVAVGQLISDVISSLKDSTGAAHQYRHLVLELEGLHKALIEVDRLDGPEELLPTINAIKATALNCRFPPREFREKTKKYDASLGVGNSAGRFKDAHMMVRWGVGKKEAVDELRMKVNAHVGCISMFVGLFQMRHSIPPY